MCEGDGNSSGCQRNGPPGQSEACLLHCSTPVVFYRPGQEAAMDGASPQAAAAQPERPIKVEEVTAVRRHSEWYRCAHARHDTPNLSSLQCCQVASKQAVW